MENKQDLPKLKAKGKESEEQKANIEVDLLKWLYYENKDILQRESEALQNDITEEFYTFIEDKIKNREIINVAVREGGIVTGVMSKTLCASGSTGGIVEAQLRR